MAVPHHEISNFINHLNFLRSLRLEKQKKG